MGYSMPLPNIMEAVQGVRYPADASSLLQKAESNGAARTTLKLLARLPDRQYRNVSEVNHALGEIEGHLPSDQNVWGHSNRPEFKGGNLEETSFSRQYNQDLE